MNGSAQNFKTRLIVTTDISSLEGGFKEPDDTQSLVRLLLYSNEFDIEGLIATYTGHWKGIRPEYIEAVVREYGKVRENLAVHDSRYPFMDYLLSCIKNGSPQCGLDQIGPGKDTEASEWIISVIDQPDPRPVWFTIWGAPTDLAQAIWKVAATRNPVELKAFKAKLRVYSIGDQYDGTGPWIRENHPDIFYIAPKVVYRGIYRGGNTELVSKKWLEENICKEHGPLGEAYPIYDGGDIYKEFLCRVSGIKEGDTPSFLYLIPNGLGDPMNPQWGNWGGRFKPSHKYPETQFFDDIDTFGEESGEWVAVSRWRADFQADFKARMDWCIKTYQGANHHPVAVLNGESRQSVSSGTDLELSAEGSYDPDGDNLSYKWYYYPEPSSYKGILLMSGQDGNKVRIRMPKVDEAKTIHLILSVTDNGNPALTSYNRVVVTVVP